MKHIFLAAMSLACLMLLTESCHSHDHEEDSHVHAPTSVEPEPAALSYTIWSKATELFVEFAPFVAGQESSFAAHFTEMTTFKAIEKGKAMVGLFENDKEIMVDATDGPASPGIFRMELTPLHAGTFDLVFTILAQDIKDTITLKNITVYSDKETALAANPHQEEGDEISFLKEQAWKIDFAIEKAKRQTIQEVIHTSGEIQPVKGEERVLAAKTSGIVFFKSNKIQEGRDIRKGEQLFSISSKGLVQTNLEEQFKVAKARLEKTKADYERAEELLAEQFIGEKEYEQRKMDYSIAEAEFQTLTGSYNKSGQMLSAPMSGIIKNVLVSDGQFVEEGTPLIEITRNRRLLVHADVSQQYLPKIPLIRSANFKTPYMESVQSTDDYNGKLVSYGKMVEAGSGFIPVVFELDNLGRLIPGSFVELFLLTKPLENALVIPKTALLEDYNSHYVYVQTEGESFEKRVLQLGINDGINVQVLSGISEGEWVVTKGAYQVKMASMSSAIPTHGHAH
ncbi:MAG: efflux RND transporter periplasmic adaptor subunit [Bacteroidetes bacterium]|nr:efflux RND transporter periplasmic adaptor subunit [Bacteroidota bacterium]